jgi:GNAT superfamily N-acetyltransferase
MHGSFIRQAAGPGLRKGAGDAGNGDIDAMANTLLAGIQKIELPIEGIEQLGTEARDEGFSFIARLLDEWASAENRFSGRGETLCGYLDRGLLVAVGGLNRDPFAADSGIGRVRRVYVRPAWRNRGIGKALVATLIEEARKNFDCVRLRAQNADAARLYERIGFVSIASPDATHILTFDKS